MSPMIGPGGRDISRDLDNYITGHYGEDDPANEPGWLCTCGNWQEDDSHCSACGREPPWGCDCGEHDEEQD